MAARPRPARQRGGARVIGIRDLVRRDQLMLTAYRAGWIRSRCRRAAPARGAHAGAGRAIGAIGPVWNGSEVWLIASGGSLMVLSARVTSAFSGFYLALMLVLWLLILRGGIGYDINSTIRCGVRPGMSRSRRECTARGAVRRGARESCAVCRSMPTAISRIVRAALESVAAGRRGVAFLLSLHSAATISR